MRTLQRGLARASSPLRPLPGFLIIGGIRCGTTSMIRYLGGHPGVATSSRPEVHYFDRNHDRGALWYRSWFPVSTYGRCVGESSPTYLMEPEVPERAASLIPDVRLLVLLRDPVERALSHYSWRRHQGSETRSLLQALDEERRGSTPSRRGRISLNRYFDQGSYILGLDVWFRVFPRERFHLIRSEDFFRDPAEVYRGTLDFLGLEPHRADFSIHNSTPRVDVEKGTIERLRIHYQPLNVELYERTGIDFRY